MQTDLEPPKTSVVTFLTTDLEGSVGRWKTFPQVMGAIIARHDDLIPVEIDLRDGVVFKTSGDGLIAASTHPRPPSRARSQHRDRPSNRRVPIAIELVVPHLRTMRIDDLRECLTMQVLGIRVEREVQYKVCNVSDREAIEILGGSASNDKIKGWGDDR